MKIQVTQEHINQGIKGARHSCPVARALADMVQKDTYLDVDEESICIGDDIHSTPKRTALKILDYDNGRGMVPFSFSLKLPKSILKNKE